MTKTFGEANRFSLFHASKSKLDQEQKLRAPYMKLSHVSSRLNWWFWLPRCYLTFYQMLVSYRQECLSSFSKRTHSLFLSITECALHRAETSAQPLSLFALNKYAWRSLIWCIYLAFTFSLAEILMSLYKGRLFSTTENPTITVATNRKKASRVQSRTWWPLSSFHNFSPTFFAW